MYLPDVELHEAHSLDEASELLTRFSPDVRALAGGTDLLVDLKSGRLSVHHLVSLNRLPELRGVRADAAGLCIGALTTPNELLRIATIRTDFPAFFDALGAMAAPQVRNMATIGGNITSSVPSADLPPILICHRASAIMHHHSGRRSVPLQEFFLGPRRNILRPGEILAEVLLPFPPSRFGAAYARFALREANACAVAGVAAAIELNSDGSVEAACVTLGAVAPTPTPVKKAAAMLIGRTPCDQAFDEAAGAAVDASTPISDIRGSADFRRDIVRVLTKRALVRALQRARENRG